eukprot:snap_masked-scaffold_17-processed-gene-1.13-mRNA-1 protein AED:1.00 eAED:1.00 QI:0/0/0/0/1/1/2/0/370
MFGWILAFRLLAQLSLKGDIIRIYGLTETRNTPELCFDMKFAYNRTKFLPYTECATYEEPLLIEHFIHPASTKFINFTLLYERESSRNIPRSIERENIINTEFTNCKEYLKTMKLSLDSYYSTILQEASIAVEIIPFASIQSEELLSSSACLESQTSIDCILLHTFSTLNSTFFIQSEIEKNIPLNYSKNLKLIEDVCEGTESSPILQQIDEVANILNLGGILWTFCFGSILCCFKFMDDLRKHRYEDDHDTLIILFEFLGFLLPPFIIFPYIIYALLKLRALIEHINTYKINNVEISLDIGNEIKNSESGLRGFLIWIGISLLILLACLHSCWCPCFIYCASRVQEYSKWYKKYGLLGVFTNREYYKVS